jgi:hypothetical protein
MNTQIESLIGLLNEADLGIANLQAKVAGYLNPMQPKSESDPVGALELNTHISREADHIRTLLSRLATNLNALKEIE